MKEIVRDSDGRGIVIEDVDGLEAAIGADGLALVWEDRIVMDAKWRKHPVFRRYMVWHELQHVRFVRKYGMSGKAGLLNRFWDASYYLGIPIMLALVTLILNPSLPTWAGSLAFIAAFLLGIPFSHAVIFSLWWFLRGRR